MPGLVGFCPAPEGQNPKTILENMRAMITYSDRYRQDELFTQGDVHGTRSHTGIIQLTPQPIETEGLRIWLDGEFYSHEALARDATMSDPELLSEQFRHSVDAEVLKKIDGIYTAVVYEPGKRRVHLITDRYGLRQLYWTVQRKCLIWSSEAKAILAWPGFSPRIDRRALSYFLERGYLPENRTWFEGVEVLSPGSMLTWDLRSRDYHRQNYWTWDMIRSMEGRLDLEELVGELGRLFMAAVQRRSKDGRLGVMLSGGLDSRALLAAMPNQDYPIPAITFGKSGSRDVRLATAAAGVRGASHHVVDLNRHNWLEPRQCGIWWTDGQLDLMHMHDIGAFAAARETMDIFLSGYLGDATVGGSFLRHRGDSELALLAGRGRRMIAQGPRLWQVLLHVRMPFFDNDFLSLALAIPATLRAKSYIYNKMLLRYFPEYFRTIPWQRTGVPISWPRGVVQLRVMGNRLMNRLRHTAGRLVPGSGSAAFADYTAWLRSEPARPWVSALLENREAFYLDYVQRGDVLAQWRAHLRGRDCTKMIGRYLTFEIWLQQVFANRFRDMVDPSEVAARADGRKPGVV